MKYSENAVTTTNIHQRYLISSTKERRNLGLLLATKVIAKYIVSPSPTSGSPDPMRNLRLTNQYTVNTRLGSAGVRL
jgi:hypothetical protein